MDGDISDKESFIDDETRSIRSKASMSGFSQTKTIKKRNAYGTMSKADSTYSRVRKSHTANKDVKRTVPEKLTISPRKLHDDDLTE